MAHDKAYTFVAALLRRSKNRTATNLDHYAKRSFGKVLRVGGKVNNAFELFEWFVENYRGLPRDKLLARFAGTPEFEGLRAERRRPALSVLRVHGCGDAWHCRSFKRLQALAPPF